MEEQKFVTDYWYRDISVLTDAKQKLATSLLVFIALELPCRPYQHESKPEKISDRQTMFLHPVTGEVCLVISIDPNPEVRGTYHIRLYFYDKDETITASFTRIDRAPGTQWERKAERRFVVTEEMPMTDIRSAIKAIVARGQ